MAKTVLFNKMQNIKIIFELNANTDKMAQTGNFHIAKINLEGESVGNGIKHTVSVGTFLGAGQADKYTPKELHTAVKNLNGNIIANKLKDLYTAGIDEDITL
ncbi:MAG: hypothetical protein GY928_20630 [Colwellia sp.]|nr:hypothetical protein [Colwellia sp.]